MPIKHEEITGIFLREDRRWDLTMMGQIDTSGVPVVGAGGGGNGEAGNSNGNGESANIPGILSHLSAPTNNYHYLTIKGPAEEDELEIGLTYRFYGRHVDHPRFGPQFHFQTFTIASPHGKRGITSYLQHCPGVGKALAEALWKQYGTEAVATLRADPGLVAAEIKNLSAEVAIGAAKFLTDHQALENCSIDLVELFAARGFPKRIVKEATKIWGNNAAAIVRRNPYLLMRFRGVGFLKCDALYLDLGLNPNRIKRQALAVWHALASDTEGHTFFPVQFGANAIGQRVASAHINAPKAMMLAKRSKLIGVYRDEQNRLWIADGKKAGQEEAVAQYVSNALCERDSDQFKKRHRLNDLHEPRGCGIFDSVEMEHLPQGICDQNGSVDGPEANGLLAQGNR